MPGAVAAVTILLATWLKAPVSTTHVISSAIIGVGSIDYPAEFQGADTTALAEMGVSFTRAKVGDRYVLEALVEKGWECGGENSGHLLCLDCHSTNVPKNLVSGRVDAVLLHVLLELQPHGIGLRFVVPALDVGNDPFPMRPGSVGSFSAFPAPQGEASIPEER